VRLHPPTFKLITIYLPVRGVTGAGSVMDKVERLMVSERRL
jgi:hypothetical protein